MKPNLHTYLDQRKGLKQLRLQNLRQNFLKLPNFNHKFSIDFASIIGENGTGKTKALELLHLVISKIMKHGKVIENVENPYLLIKRRVDGRVCEK